MDRDPSQPRTPVALPATVAATVVSGALVRTPRLAAGRQLTLGRNWRFQPKSVLAVTLGLNVSASVLMIGTVHFAPLLVVVVLSVGLAGYAYWACGAQVYSRTRMPFLLGFAIAVYTALQAVPLPREIVAIASPLANDIWDRAYVTLRETNPEWRSISLDPAATAVEAMKMVAYLGTFIGGAVLGSIAGAESVGAIVFASSVMLSVVTLSHGIAGLTKVYGWYQPEFTPSTWHVGPLLNPNNLAEYLNFGSMCGFGLLLSKRPFVPRPFVVAGLITVIGVTALSASRAGFALLPVGVGVALGLSYFRRTKADHANGTPAWTGVAIAAAGGAVVALLGATPSTWTELGQGGLSKLDLDLWSLRLIRDYPIFGVGRGAFQTVFPHYQETGSSVLFTHVENFLVQWACDWGLPVTGIILAVGARLFGPGNLGVFRSSVTASIWAGFILLCLHNMVDLGFEIPAICIALSAAIGAVWGDAGRRRVKAERLWPGEHRIMYVVPVIVAAILFSGVKLASASYLQGERRDMHARLEHATNDPSSWSTYWRELRLSMGRHPADPYFPFLGAVACVRTHTGNPIAWIQRSLERAPSNAQTHLLLATVLSRSFATAQAMLAVRTAVAGDPTTLDGAVTLAFTISERASDLMRAAPPGAAGAPMLLALAAHARVLNLADVALDLGRMAAASEPGLRPAHHIVIEELFVRLARKDDVICGRDLATACAQEIEQHAADLQRYAPNLSDGARTLARLFEFRGRPDLGEALLATQCELVSDRVPCLQARARLAADLGQADRLQAVTSTLSGAACTSPAACADMATWIGNLQAHAGLGGSSLRSLVRAAEDDPNRERWLRVADAAEGLGLPGRAIAAVKQAASFCTPGDQEIAERLARLEALRPAVDAR